MPEYVLAPVDDEICLRIGRVVTRWTVLEKSISLLLGTALLTDQSAMSVVTSGVSISTQTKWIRTLLNSHEHEAEQNKPVLELLNRVDDLRQERNELVHGMWDPSGCEPGTSQVTTTNLDRTEIMRTRLVTTQDLDDLCHEIDMWIEEYVALGRKLNFPRNRGELYSMFR
jgi:hypothetical protein